MNKILFFVLNFLSKKGRAGEHQPEPESFQKDDTPQLLCVASSYTDNTQETITALASSPRQHRHHLKQMNHFD